MGQDQSKGGSGPQQQQQPHHPPPPAGGAPPAATGGGEAHSLPSSQGGSPETKPGSFHLDPASRGTSASPGRAPSQAPSMLAGSTAGGFSSSSALVNIPRAFTNDDEVIALWQQLAHIPLQLPLLKGTALPPDEEIKNLVASLSSGDSSLLKPPGDNNSEPASPLSPFLAELRRRAISATTQNNPNYSQRVQEVTRMQKQQQQQQSDSSASPAPLTSQQQQQHATATPPITISAASTPAASPAASALSATTSASVASNKKPLPTISVAPLLQTLGRTQTMSTREIQRGVQRCEKVAADSKVLAQELQALRGGALQTVRLGQKCYSVETETKRLHLEIHGDEKGTAASKSIGHDGPFPPLKQLCEETADLLHQIDDLLGAEPKKKLQEYAAHITSRTAPAPRRN